MKRVIDILVALLFLFLLSPLLLIVALAIKIESPGPVFYRQIRVGSGCRRFKIYKLRSMIQDADKKGGIQTNTNDSRITRVGRFIRKTSIDELPQLYNVLVGDMSLVGPRPDVPEQVTNYTKSQWVHRHKVKPGITGLAQSGARSDISLSDRIRSDLEYVDTATIYLDFKIIAKTVVNLLTQKGIN